jgi:hypothetical protein
MAFTYITLTAGSGYRRADGAIPRARIRATPYVEMVNGTRTVNQEVVVPLSSAGVGTKTIAATTDPATTPVGNAYRFTVEVDGYPVRQFIAAVPHDAGSSVSIDSLTAVVSPPNLTVSYSLVVLTQAQYNALSSPDAHTLYVVVG